jgi:hypothetical protein
MGVVRRWIAAWGRSGRLGWICVRYTFRQGLDRGGKEAGLFEQKSQKTSLLMQTLLAEATIASLPHKGEGEGQRFG